MADRRIRQYPLRVVGSGPFPLPGERKRLARARAHGEAFAALLRDIAGGARRG